MLTFAAFIAYFLDFERSYWVPLSCAAVMSGSTIIATFHRTVQRMFGTIIGLLIAGVILSVVHNGYIISLIILLLTFFTEIVYRTKLWIGSYVFHSICFSYGGIHFKSFDFLLLCRCSVN